MTEAFGISVNRLDTELTRRGLAPSREKAKAMIAAGYVTVNGKQAVKPAAEVTADTEIIITKQLEYVGRGGYKLEKALSVFGIDPKGKIALDIGASTGGFTDCLLRNGAEKVYAVDVGQGQLAESLRSDSRVVSFEKTDIRAFDPSVFNGALPQIITADVSFISLTKILPSVAALAADGCSIVLLLKPQFEAGKTKKGIVSSADIHLRVALSVIESAKALGLYCKGFDFSPVKGGDGNIEFLLFLNTDSFDTVDKKKIELTVTAAHSTKYKP